MDLFCKSVICPYCNKDAKYRFKIEALHIGYLRIILQRYAVTLLMMVTLFISVKAFTIIALTTIAFGLIHYGLHRLFSFIVYFRDKRRRKGIPRLYTFLLTCLHCRESFKVSLLLTLPDRGMYEVKHVD
ncbi:hypothetical protein [Desulfosarcina ovata]|uniref:Uncharacterized protein n=1 Tax=Desulfosarcina ovata subsp. ovata TaxID=2752305 RepID=A0A5K8A6Z9_9BACT|nr:hypothetical protein [Desulfosarcina ovata]BBO88251.1 hypothetical protein DSCOOX_14310 [Desulfosarcina ovata subsp. ovata]